jgi:hypothetical protein
LFDHAGDIVNQSVQGDALRRACARARAAWVDPHRTVAGRIQRPGKIREVVHTQATTRQQDYDITFALTEYLDLRVG